MIRNWFKNLWSRPMKGGIAPITRDMVAKFFEIHPEMISRCDTTRFPVEISPADREFVAFRPFGYQPHPGSSDAKPPTEE